MEKMTTWADENFALAFWGFFIINALGGQLPFDKMPRLPVLALMVALIFGLIVLWQAASMKSNGWRTAVKVYVVFQFIAFIGGFLIGLGAI